MKYCDFCGSQCKGSAQVCPACGGNTFSRTCKNCGRSFDAALKTCPDCGVHIYQSPRRCPVCGRNVYTPVCPGCGAEMNATPEETGTRNAGVGQRTNLTWLWVLGWIFCFPIPLTVLIVRTPRLQNWVKALLIALLWAFILLIGLSGDPADEAAAAARPAAQICCVQQAQR